MRTRSGEGWGQLPRAIARAFAGINLGSNESKVVWAIVYKTIAFNKIEDKIPGSQLVDLTGIEKRNMYRAVNSLLKKGVIFKKDSVYGIQRDFSKWEKVSVETLTVKRCQYEEKKVSVEEKKVSLETHSRDLSKRTIQERVFSKPPGGKKEREVPEGLKTLMEDIGNMPGKRKEISHLIKKRHK